MGPSKGSRDVMAFLRIWDALSASLLIFVIVIVNFVLVVTMNVIVSFPRGGSIFHSHSPIASSFIKELISVLSRIA